MLKRTLVVLLVLILSFSSVVFVRYTSINLGPLNNIRYLNKPDSSNQQPNIKKYQPQNSSKKNNSYTHVHSVEPDMPLSEIMQNKKIKTLENINLYIDSETRTMLFRSGDVTLKEYSISAGTKTYEGDKEREGDFRTPRGEFYICTKTKYSPPKGYLGSRWMLLSYPNKEDAERGLRNGLITQVDYNQINKCISRKAIPPQDTLLGSAIGIHGGANPNLSKDWTAGCIGMYDEDIEEIFEYIDTGTRVIIK